MVRRKVKFEKENKLLMIGRKILLVLITTFIGILTANWLASFLPQYYESTSLLGCVPPIISGGSNIGICSEEDVSQRLNSLNAEVLSNSSLEPIIKKYNVGANKKLPIEIQVEQMRKRILVKPEKTENKHLFAFRVSYRDENPETARNIVKELADKFVEVVSIPDSIGCSMNGLLEKQIEEKKLEIKKLKKKGLIKTQEYEEQIANYGRLLQKFDDVKFEEEYAKDYQIKVVDPANLPTSIVNYRQINGIGAGIGFLFGLMLVLRASFGKRILKVDLR